MPLEKLRKQLDVNLIAQVSVTQASQQKPPSRHHVKTLSTTLKHDAMTFIHLDMTNTFHLRAGIPSTSRYRPDPGWQPWQDLKHVLDLWQLHSALFGEQPQLGCQGLLK